MGRLITVLLDALVLFFIVRMILRLFTGSRRPQRSRPTTSSPERSGGTLVRDPQCGTYIPQSRAIRVGSGNQALYFCSPACRDAYERRT